MLDLVPHNVRISQLHGGSNIGDRKLSRKLESILLKLLLLPQLQLLILRLLLLQVLKGARCIEKEGFISLGYSGFHELRR
ncbi:unnamed protein product [Arabis nemorensis]|uniref:Uncharacterized protein n=1 Tax=Arabis nemorensis TaxID=586526 RepID=A0A565C222_9BRAS|nr:unnamed protein product [Arabis nemorensis]